MAWLYCWLALTVFQLFMLYLAPVVIMPVFNKFIPIEEGELKAAITDYASGQQFALEGIYTMDGSRRSTKSNAFFTGFGRFGASYFSIRSSQSTPCPSWSRFLPMKPGIIKWGMC